MSGADPRRLVLWTALALNAGAFVVEFSVGQLAHSAALLGDSADMLGDALTYALTLAVLVGTARGRAWAVLFKAGLQLAFALILMILIWMRLGDPHPPGAAAIGWTALLALTVNTACAWLLASHRHNDLNMRSVWLCSRNDLIANLCMIAAAGLVAWTGSAWPDVLLGGAVVALFLRTSLHLLAQTLRRWPESAADRHPQALTGGTAPGYPD